LADNSLHAYRRDLEDAEDFLSKKGVSLSKAAADDFRAYLQSQSRKGQSTRTIARRVAAIRVFLRYQAGEGRDTAPILQQLERPKPERSLPKVLSRAHVNQLIAAPNPKSSLFARDVATRAIKRGFDKKTALPLRSFFYLPFEHSESLADQVRASKLFKSTKDQELVRWAKLHHDIIRRFGRFPHRNEILGRPSTPEEVAFLEAGGFGG